MTAPVDLDHLDALAKAAPPGPYTLNEDAECISNPTGTWPIETSRFMVAVCNAYTAMSAELRRLREQRPRVDCCCYEGAHKRWAERAKKAEARAKELEAEKLAFESRVAELQALVDAATRFELPPFAVWKACDAWWLTDERDEPWSGQHRPQPSRDEAIAIARDLAAKEKEPTR